WEQPEPRSPRARLLIRLLQASHSLVWRFSLQNTFLFARSDWLLQPCTVPQNTNGSEIFVSEPNLRSQPAQAFPVTENQGSLVPLTVLARRQVLLRYVFLATDSTHKISPLRN